MYCSNDVMRALFRVIVHVFTVVLLVKIITLYNTITYSTGDVMISSITDDTNYTINGRTSGTSYRISVVPTRSMGMCQGVGKEMMVDTTDVLISISTSIGKSIIRISNKTPAI